MARPNPGSRLTQKAISWKLRVYRPRGLGSRAIPSAAAAGTQTRVESRKLDLMTPTPNGSGVGEGDGPVAPGWTGRATSQLSACQATWAASIIGRAPVTPGRR